VVAFAHAAGVAGLRADERVKGLFVRAVITDDSDDAAKLYGKWSGFVLAQVQNDIRSALEDLTTDEQGQYLKDIDIEIRSVPKLLSQNDFEAMWQKPNVLLVIQGIPQAHMLPQNPSSKDFGLDGTAFLGPKIGSLNKKWKYGIRLSEVMQAGASRASTDALVLIILYSLIENAILEEKGNEVICGLITEAHNFLSDVELHRGADSSVTENTEEFAVAIASRLDLHNRARSCLHNG
jgi:hypothetical protein